MKKVTSVLFVLVLLALALPVCVAAANPVTPEGLYYEVVDDQVIIIDCVESTTGELTIPAEIAGYPVTAIGNAAFFECVQLSAVVIPESVTSIGSDAFGSCLHLSEVNIPSAVESIGNDAFRNTAYYNNEKKWDNYLLYIDGCLVAADTANLTGSAVINEGTRLIADYAVFGSKITAVSIPVSVKAVGKNAFAECTKLADVYYGGKAEAWKALAIADGNAALGKAKMHYGKVLDKPDPQGNTDTNTNTQTVDEEKPDLWLWVSIISGVVAVITAVMMFLPKKKEQPAEEEKAEEKE